MASIIVGLGIMALIAVIVYIGVIYARSLVK